YTPHFRMQEQFAPIETLQLWKSARIVRKFDLFDCYLCITLIRGALFAVRSTCARYVEFLPNKAEISAMALIRIALRGLLLAIMLVVTIYAQEQKPLAIADALGVLSFANRMPIALSSDGQWVAYTVEDDRKRESTREERYMYYTPTGAFTEAVGCDVWVTNTRTGESRNLTQGKGT